jgi:DNA invertase Pin-like site-specific DNA recombinase
LRWATRKENMADQLLDGTRNQGERNGGSRLAEAQIHEIRRLYDGGMPVAELSARYGIAKNHVHQIGRRTRWRYLPEQ